MLLITVAVSLGGSGGYLQVNAFLLEPGFRCQCINVGQGQKKVQTFVFFEIWNKTLKVVFTTKGSAAADLQLKSKWPSFITPALTLRENCTPDTGKIWVTECNTTGIIMRSHGCVHKSPLLLILIKMTQISYWLQRKTIIQFPTGYIWWLSCI